MNHDQALSVALALMDAGYKVEVIMAVDEPAQTCFSVAAQKTRDNGQAWTMIHIQDMQDVAALAWLFPKGFPNRKEEE